MSTNTRDITLGQVNSISLFQKLKEWILGLQEYINTISISIFVLFSSNTTGATSGAKTTSCFSVVSFLCNILKIIVCPLSFGHCVVWPSIYGFWLPLWCLQTFLKQKISSLLLIHSCETITKLLIKLHR